MKNNKLIGIILALLVCLSVIVSVSATTESDVTVTMGSTDPMATNEAIGAIVAAPEDTVSVAIAVEQNAGLYSIAPTVKYDATALEFVSATAQGMQLTVKDVEGGKQLIIGDLIAALLGNAKPTTVTGNIVVVEFKVLATDADKATQIDMNLDAVNFLVPETVNVAAQTASVAVNITSVAHECNETITVNDKAATCTEVGATGDVHCAFCGTLITASEEIDVLGHNYNLEVDGEITKAPDCLNTGIMVYNCLNEGCDVVKEVVMEVAHEAVVPVPEKAPTCYEEGNTAGTMCQKCGKTLTGEKLDKIAHTYNEGVETKSPTCTAEGAMVYTCTVEACGYVKTEVINATGHTYVAVEAEDPTCEKSGHTAGSKCACGVYETEPTVIEALGHNLTTEVTAATCEEDGKEVTTCSRCDYNTEVVLSAQGHKYTMAATYATCETEGFVVYTCSVCDYQYEDDKVEAFGHKYGDYKVVTAPTRTLPGTEEATCARCNAVTARRIEALGGPNPVIIVIIVVVVLTGVAVGAYFFLKSKKQSGKN